MTIALDIQFGGFSAAGGKEDNQDAFAVYRPDPEVVRFKGIGACVADGASSSANAQQASSTSVTDFLNDYYSTPDSWDVKRSAGKVLTSLNSWLYHHGKQASSHNNGLVTTFSCAVVHGSTAHFFHVGDSRVYLWSANSLEQVTRDHVHEGGGNTYLSRSLGMDSHIEVDYFQRDVQQGDIFLLTTDGVHAFVSRKNMVDAMNAVTSESSQAEIEAVCSTLVKQAIEAGSDGNGTCVILQVRQVPDESLQESGPQVSERQVPAVLSAGDSIDHYQINHIIESSISSITYQVVNKRNGRLYLLKAPAIGLQENRDYLECFAREQWVAERINHRNVISAVPQEDSRYNYHVFEWIDGVSLRQWIFDNPDAEVNQVRFIVEQIIHGLRALQRAGLTYRNLTPDNVIIVQGGGVKLVDLGTVIGRDIPALKEWPVIDSMDYQAPEAILKQEYGAQSDLFALGVVIYEMLVGSPPFPLERIQERGARSDSEWRYQSIRMYRSDIPLWLDLVLKKATAPNPDDRYQAFSELREDLYRPNEQLVRVHRGRSWLARDPVGFWRWSAVALAAVAIIEALALLLND
ncbi:bifunctional protein-serine/threonine kinase/phosphatase [Oceanobacter sp. 3_MG-2023]|uniref:bifunctional protein-serine/threonine kinase/phosphatase n=1 Tax=Oceanobacter sp. 3_MG-2023 TaxID=3062622 RepID=UPI00273769BC|nr:bifunctional protein-serine/threonine kinase/phosphatase [Oceanobacter sp. 3_MG-2023]MDP2504873.1 protein kinase [Oceanobacter sp. 3_MG-2023]